MPALPALSAVTPRACYLCGTRDNPVFAREPAEHRYGRPLVPEGVYAFARCRGCGLLYVDSDVTEGYLADLYREETIDVGHDSDAHAEAHVARRRPEFLKHWRAMACTRAPKHGERLLDLGCQLGDFGLIAQRDGVIPHGIDLSKSYVEACRGRWGTTGTLHCGTALNAPFAPGSFHYVTAFEVLEHMLDPLTTLRHLRRLLRPDGLFAMSVPSSHYFRLKYWALRSGPLSGIAKHLTGHRPPRRVLPHTHAYSFSHRSLRALLERAGFRVLRIETTGWHGRIGRLAEWPTRGLELASAKRIGISPSIFALAVP